MILKHLAEPFAVNRPAKPAHRTMSAVALISSLLILSGVSTTVASSEQGGGEEGQQTDSPHRVQGSSETSTHVGTGEGEIPFHANRDMVYLPDAKESLFAELDTDNDAAITEEEAQAHPALAEQFERIDTQGNGRITRAEFAAFEVEAGDSPQE